MFQLMFSAGSIHFSVFQEMLFVWFSSWFCELTVGWFFVGGAYCVQVSHCFLSLFQDCPSDGSGQPNMQETPETKSSFKKKEAKDQRSALCSQSRVSEVNMSSTWDPTVRILLYVHFKNLQTGSLWCEVCLLFGLQRSRPAARRRVRAAQPRRPEENRIPHLGSRGGSCWGRRWRQK